MSYLFNEGPGNYVRLRLFPGFEVFFLSMLISYLVKSTQNKKLYMRMSTYFTLILDIYQDRVDISHFKYTAHTYWTRAGISH